MPTLTNLRRALFLIPVLLALTSVRAHALENKNCAISATIDAALCPTAPCYIPDAAGAQVDNPMKLYYFSTELGGTGAATVGVETKNEIGGWVSQGTATATDGKYIDGGFQRIRYYVSLRDSGATMAASVCGVR